MEGFCTRCGDCCQGINLANRMTKAEFINEFMEREFDDDAVRLDLGSAELVIDHWHPLEDDEQRFNCDLFDMETRLCTNPDRPRICAGFPWYGDTPDSTDGTPFNNFKRCGFWYDVAPENRPKNILPVV